MKTLKDYPVKVVKEYRSLRNKAAFYIQREIRYERVKRIRSAGLLCVDCNKPAVAYDHRDYFEPGKIEPVCHSCNLKRGPAIRTLERLMTGEKFSDQRNLWELTPRVIKSRYWEKAKQ